MIVGWAAVALTARVDLLKPAVAPEYAGGFLPREQLGIRHDEALFPYLTGCLSNPMKWDSLKRGTCLISDSIRKQK